MDAAGRPYVLEVNANPDIAPDAGLAAALSAAQVPFESFVSTVLENALLRQRASR